MLLWCIIFIYFTYIVMIWMQTKLLFLFVLTYFVIGTHTLTTISTNSNVWNTSWYVFQDHIERLKLTDVLACSACLPSSSVTIVIVRLHCNSLFFLFKINTIRSKTASVLIRFSANKSRTNQHYHRLELNSLPSMLTIVLWYRSWAFLVHALIVPWKI